jgi:uncharacterized membrane protein YkoI
MITAVSLCIFGFFLSSCKKQVDYFEYVSEFRNNIFLAQTGEISLRIYSVKKENPYVADGIPKEISTRTEVYLTTHSGDKNCVLSFQVNGKDYGGEMSYDNVKAEYYFSCTLDTSALQEIHCHIEYGETTTDIQATSVLKSDTLTPKNILQNVQNEEQELFRSMTDKYGFAGEIYLRLIYEDSPYYYVGVIDRNGNTYAFLVNAQTGKILARRQS